MVSAIPVAHTSGAIENIGRAVKEERTRRHLTTYVLADMAGVNRMTVTRMEAGAPVQLHSALCVMAALGLTMSVHTHHEHAFEEVCKVCGQKRGEA